MGVVVIICVLCLKTWFQSFSQHFGLINNNVSVINNKISNNKSIINNFNDNK